MHPPPVALPSILANRRPLKTQKFAPGYFSFIAKTLQGTDRPKGGRFLEEALALIWFLDF